MAKVTYDDLIFKLGDLAREHLADDPKPSKAMQAVFEAEDVVVAVREEVAALEQELNDEDADYRHFLDSLEAEKEQQSRITRRWATAVSGVETRSRALKKQISSQKAAARYLRKSLKLAEVKFKELEQREGHDLQKVSVARENLKKLRLQSMRDQRNLEELEYEFKSVLTPRAGQPGAAGILAHRRLMEMEDELEERKATHEEKMKAFDETIGAKEVEQKAAEDELDHALYALGEETYAERTAHPALSLVYLDLDRAK